MQNKQSDYPDFIGIIVMLVINSTVSFIKENNAGNAAAAHVARLTPKAKVRFGYKKEFFLCIMLPLI